MANLELLGGVPDTGLTYKKLIDHLREAQDCAAVLGHLHGPNDPLHGQGWLAVSENINKTVDIIAMLAAKGFHTGH